MKIGLIGDIHEDIVSLKVALRQLEKHNCDELICLGDIVGYDVSCHEQAESRNPSACIAAIRSNCRYAVVGNHDLFALKKLPQSTHAFSFPPTWYDLTLQERRALSGSRVWLYETESTGTRLSRRDRHYLDALPEHLVLTLNNQSVHFSHSFHPDLTGSLMLRPHNPWELREHLQILKSHGCSFGFSGHLHPNGVIVGKDNDICEAPFGTLALARHLAHYACPGIANCSGRQGYTIVDTVKMTIQTFTLDDDKNRGETWYERLFT
jgi:predicted phosphodiesterase